MPKSGKIRYSIKWTQMLHDRLRKLQGGYKALSDGDHLFNYHNHETLGREGSCIVRGIIGQKTTCRICEPRKLRRYKELEEDYARTENVADIDERKGMVIKFHIHPEVMECRQLLVNNRMNTFQVIKSLAIQDNISDYYQYHILEYWQDYEAERVVEDHEMIIRLKIDHMKSNHDFLFAYQRDLDKYEVFRNSEQFFIHPLTARERNAKKRQRHDPRRIQVLDKRLVTPVEGQDEISDDSEDDTPTEEPSRVESIPEDIVEISAQSEGSAVQFSKGKGQLPTVSETPATTPPKPVQLKLEVEEEPVAASSSPVTEEAGLSSIIPSLELSGQSSLEEPTRTKIQDDKLNPIYCSTVFVKHVDPDGDLTVTQIKKLPRQKEKASWSKKYLLLRDRKLFFVDDHENMLKFYYMDDEKFREKLNQNPSYAEVTSVKQGVDKTEDKIKATVSRKDTKSQPEVAQPAFYEIQERERRKAKVLIFGLKGSEAETKEGRIKNDLLQEKIDYLEQKVRSSTKSPDKGKTKKSEVMVSQHRASPQAPSSRSLARSADYVKAAAVLPTESDHAVVNEVRRKHPKADPPKAATLAGARVSHLPENDKPINVNKMSKSKPMTMTDSTETTDAAKNLAGASKKQEENSHFPELSNKKVSYCLSGFQEGPSDAKWEQQKSRGFLNRSRKAAEFVYNRPEPIIGANKETDILRAGKKSAGSL